MKTFTEFVLECSSLTEGGMSRVVSHSKSRNTAVLTATRGDKSNKENKKSNNELR